MYPRVLPGLVLTVLTVLTAATLTPSALQRRPTLGNGRITAVFGDRGLTSLADVRIGRTFAIREDEFAVTLDGKAIDSRSLGDPRREASRERVLYRWTAGNQQIHVVYELQPDWHFISKRIEIPAGPGAVYRVEEVEVFDLRFSETVADSFVPRSIRPALGTGDYGAVLRFADRRGLLAVVQNPFLESAVGRDSVTVRYRPDMEWRAEYGPFQADRGLLGGYRLTGRTIPAEMTPEWKLPVEETAAPGLDEAEVAAFTDMVRAFLLYKPERPLNVMVGWCSNDYQIDVATEEGREEYTRLLDRAKALGAEYVLYAPSNSALSRREQSVDDWSWEHVLWLGLGQKIRANEWSIENGPIPPSVQEMLDRARARDLKLLAYVYPVVPFSHNPEWLVPGRNPDRTYASLGVRSLQDWLIDALVTFHQRTGIGGYAFDHTFLTYEGTSRYAQWYGWRRVMEELRRRIPDIAIDGRQAYHLYGPWSWLAGSYPHPTYSDEQPESFVPFPDLHFDRVSANRQRYTAYRYRNYDFAPSEIVPGFITHQTPRLDDNGRMPERRTDDRGVLLESFRARDWDYLGWRYSLISSIATAGWNNVINMIPARDPEEFRHFPEADQVWFRGWIDWARRNREYLRRTRTILGPPAIGQVDGTSAIVGDRGFVFLFNPNGRQLDAEFALDASIGLAAEGRFLLRELYPVAGRLIGKPGSGLWTSGDRVSVPLHGGSALVLELEPAPAAITEPIVFNVPGRAARSGDSLVVTDVRGEFGTEAELLVLLPEGDAPTSVTVNGVTVSPTQAGERLLSAPLRFAGEPFTKLQPAASVDPAFAGGVLKGSFRIPQRVFDQLAARRRVWPIPWTPEDFRSPWLAPERLLLFVQIAEPDARWDARLTIDGRTVELKKAYSAVRAAPRTFVGFYADLSLLEADREYQFTLELPKLAPGQLQGVFFENVEPEYTTELLNR